MAKTLVIINDQKQPNFETQSGVPVRLKQFSNAQKVQTKKPVFHKSMKSLIELYNLKKK